MGIGYSQKVRDHKNLGTEKFYNGYSDLLNVHLYLEYCHLFEVKIIDSNTLAFFSLTYMYFLAVHEHKH